MNLTLRRQSVVRGLRRDGCMGRARQTRTQPGGEVSDQFGFISEVGHSSGRRNGAPAECSVRKMAVLTVIADCLGRAEPRGLLRCLARAKHRGLLLVPWSGEASRPLESCFSGGARRFLTVSPVCGRRNEGAEARHGADAVPAECRAGATGVKRVQSWRVSHRARAEQCRYLARGEWFGACAWPRPSASVGSVKPGLPGFS